MAKDAAFGEHELLQLTEQSVLLFNQTQHFTAVKDHQDCEQ